MDKTPTYEETLVARYLHGEATAEEVRELKNWLDADAANQDYFRETRNTWVLSEMARAEVSTDVDKEWSAFATKHGITSQTKERTLSRSSWHRLSRIAAAFLILIVPSLIYFLFFMTPAQNSLVAEDHLLESTLPDGTEVALNKGSVLQYAKNFRGKERKVVLEGEAYFDVVRNEKKAFVIDAEEMMVRVLGTSFYVNTNGTDNTMEVVLLSGSVQLDYNLSSMVLEPGEKAIISKSSGEIEKEQNNDPNLLAWKTKVLRFNNTPLSELISVLEKVYNKDILIMNPDLLKCRITATFEGETFESVLQVIKSTLNITIRPNGNMIEFSGEGCE
jgi:ferric-dicitrate binding protein FerR (iron transport regulator)